MTFEMLGAAPAEASTKEKIIGGALAVGTGILLLGGLSATALAAVAGLLKLGSYVNGGRR